MVMNTRAILKAKVTEFSPELQRLQKIDNLINDTSDGMSELHEFEITTISLYRALDSHIVPLPATMALLNSIKSLRISNDRKGRQEFVTVLKRAPVYNVGGLPGYEEQQGQRPGLISRVVGLFRGNKQQPPG